MDFQDVVDRRRMIRDYDPRPVDPQLVDRAIRNATHAPSAGFSQGWGFLVLDTPADVQRWWRTTVDPEALSAPDRWLTGMMRAPVIIVPCSSETAYLQRYAERDKASSTRIRPAAQAAESAPWAMPYWHLDTAMASLLILQTVVDSGLGGCFFGIPTNKLDAVRTEFHIPDAFDPIGVITMGHRRQSTGTTGSAGRLRKAPEDVTHRGNWSSS